MINVGDYVEFGRWPQDLNGTVKDVEWRVLAIEEGTALLVSRFGLEAKRFDGSSNEWEDSELRQWLNGEFKSRMFSPEEQEFLKSEIAVPSWQEVKKLIPNIGAVRKCSPTPWAKANGAATYGGRCFWWTKTNPGGYWQDVYAVGSDGGCYQRCCRTETYCVRPLIRVSAEGLKSDGKI